MIPRGFNSFIEKPDDDLPGLCKDDQEFLEVVGSQIRQQEGGNLDMPLPFKHGTVLLDNKGPVFYRTRSTLKRICRDPEVAAKCV